MKPLLVLVILCVSAPLGVSAGQDGRLLSSAPCEPNRQTHASYVQSIKTFLARDRELAAAEGIAMPEVDDHRLEGSLYTEEEVAERLAYDGFECRAITYESDGLTIAGFHWKPINTDGKRFPLIIVNRGGNRTFGPMRPWRQWGWYDFLKAGYVVLASQYRGGPGSEGKDEFGGADVNDILNLFPLAERLGYVDTDNVFLWGHSRGAMMSAIAAKRGAPVNAVAWLAGPSDQAVSMDPAAGGRAGFDALFRELVPGYSDNREAALEARSPALWSERIGKPVILFHGTADWRVKPGQTLRLAAGLDAAGSPYELHVYDGDIHPLLFHRKQVMERVLAFFERYKTAGGTPD